MMMFSDNDRNPDYAKDPAVIRFGNRYLLYYSVPPYRDERENRGWGIGIAESSDLIHWRRSGEVPALSKLEEKGFCAPAARVFDGRVHLFYQTYGTGANDAICHAVSSDGFHFIPDATNPIFHPPVSNWSCGRAIDADLIEFQGKIFLYTATRDPDYKIQKLAVACMDRNGDFSRSAWTVPFDGSILEPELPWEQQCIEAPATCVHDGKIYLFYGGAYNNSPQQIGCAESVDGIHFTRISDLPVLPCGKPGEWNSSESGHPFVFSDSDGRDYLFFQGNPDHGKTWKLSMREIQWKNGLPVLE